MKTRTLAVTACLAGLLTADALADHNGNVRVVELAVRLAGQAESVYNQARWVRPFEHGDPWGGYAERQAVQELGRFASYARRLADQARRLEPGSGVMARTTARVGILDHNDEDIGRRLVQIFRDTWRQADNVEVYLYRAYRLTSARRSWDYGVCSTLRQLRRSLGGISPYAARDAVRADSFEALTATR